MTNDIELYVCKGFSGEIHRVRVALGDTVEQALPTIADQIGYYTPDYDKIGLYNMTRDFEYRMEELLSATATMPGDLIIMADGGACHKHD